MQQTESSQEIQPVFVFEGGHLVMFHHSPTGTINADATVNDRDRTQDLLAQEKYLTDGYNIACHEASHDELYRVMKQNLDDCHQLQRQLFNLMFKKGWYRLPVANAQAVTQADEKFNQLRSQFPFMAKGGQGQVKAGAADSMGIGAGTSTKTGSQIGTQAGKQTINQMGNQAGNQGGTAAVMVHPGRRMQ